MAKLIYITETQLNEIVGNGTYLNNQDNTNEYRLGGAEISVGGITGNYIDGDVENAEPVISDKISNQMCIQQIKGLGRNFGRRSFSDRIIPESNQDLAGKNNTMQLSKTVVDKIKKNLENYNGSGNEQGVKRAKKITKDGRISHDDGYRILHDFATNQSGSILDKSLQNDIRKKLDTAERISQNNRDAKMERGENVLKSAPKTGTKGGAHTPKGNNTIGVTYF